MQIILRVYDNHHEDLLKDKLLDSIHQFYFSRPMVDPVLRYCISNIYSGVSYAADLRYHYENFENWWMDYSTDPPWILILAGYMFGYKDY